MPPLDLAPVLAAVVGATASGKSALALALAERFDAELVSVDSMQVYRGMDIGTAKPSPEEQAAVRHHLIDLADPSEDYTVSRFQADAADALADIAARGRRAILVGGTGLYVQAVTDGFTIPGQFPEVRAAIEDDPDTGALHRRLGEVDPAAAARMEPANRRRIVRALEVTLGSGQPFSSFGPGVTAFPVLGFALLGIRRERETLDQRIGERLVAQLARGMVAEVEALHRREPPLSRTARQALGYKELLDHFARRDAERPDPDPLGLAGTAADSLEDTVELIRLRTRHFARRQERWFRRDPRVAWIAPASGADADADAEWLVQRAEAAIRSGSATMSP